MLSAMCGRMWRLLPPAPRQAGDAIMWENFLPSGATDPRARHMGCPVRSGLKYGLNIWVKADPGAVAPPGTAAGALEPIPNATQLQEWYLRHFPHAPARAVSARPSTRPAELEGGGTGAASATAPPPLRGDGATVLPCERRGDCSAADVERELRRIYRENAPGKLAGLPSLLARHKGRLARAALLVAVRRKHAAPSLHRATE